MLSVWVISVVLIASSAVCQQQQRQQQQPHSQRQQQHQAVDNDDDDEVRPTNINENFDAALEELWPYVIRNGRDRLDLPDIVEGFQYRPLFININAGVLLENGKAWNIRKVSRHADAWMILEKNVLRFYGFLMIDKVDFSYDFAARILGVYTSGTVAGVVSDTMVAGEFALNLNETNLMLNHLKIVSFGDIAIQLKSNAVVGWISEPFLRTVTRLFRSRLTTTISDGVHNYTQRLLDDVNENDRLQIKNYVHYVIPILNTRSKAGGGGGQPAAATTAIPPTTTTTLATTTIGAESDAAVSVALTATSMSTTVGVS